MQHAGHAHVLHVGVLAGGFVGDIDARHIGANHLVARDRLLRRGAGEFHVERLVAEQRAVRDRLGRVAVDRHDALVDHEAANLHAELGRGEVQQRPPRFGCRGADLRAAALDRGARGGGALVRHHIGVELDRTHLAHVEVKLFGRDLQETGGVALAEFALADIDGRGVVGMDRDPGVDRIHIERDRDVAARGERRAGRHAGHAEADNQRTAALKQIAAREIQFGLMRVHRTSPAMRVDASWIAFMTRG